MVGARFDWDCGGAGYDCGGGCVCGGGYACAAWAGSGQGVCGEWAESGWRVGGECASARGIWLKKGSFLGIGLISKYFLFAHCLLLSL